MGNASIRSYIHDIKDNINYLIKLADKYQEVLDVDFGHGLYLSYTPVKKLTKSEALAELESGKPLTEEAKKLIAEAIRSIDGVDDDWDNSWNSSNC